VALRWRAEAGGAVYGGGAGSLGRRCAVVEVVVELGGEVEGPFIGVEGGGGAD